MRALNAEDTVGARVGWGRGFEAPKASSDVGNREGVSPWASWALPVGCGAEPRPKRDFVAFLALQNASRPVRRHLLTEEP